MTALAVALFVAAAALGAGVRLVGGDQLNRELPVGTFILNVAASFTLAALSQLGPPWPAVAGVAALGTVATWATLANEVAVLTRAGQSALAWLYLAATVTSGVLAAWIGLQVS